MTSGADISGSRASHRANSSVVSTKGFDPGRWHPIELAPRDGQHILACAAGTSFGFVGKRWPAVQTVVHWWGNPGEEGFYTSVNEMEPQRPFEATHWKPLDEPGQPAGDLLASTMHLYSESDRHVVELSFKHRAEAERVFEWLEGSESAETPNPRGDSSHD